MGSLDSPRAAVKLRAPAPSLTAPASARRQRPRSRLTRFILFEKVDYFQWICAVAAFFVVLLMFQWFLPGDKHGRWGPRLGSRVRGRARNGGVLEKLGELEFGEGIRFVPTRLLERWERERKEAGEIAARIGREVRRVGVRKPRLALVFADLVPDAVQLKMVSVAMALKEIGYEIQVYSIEDGSLRSVWEAIGVHVDMVSIDTKAECTIDWLDYDGILINSLEARQLVSCLLQEPFKSIPVMWTIDERSLALVLQQYGTRGQIQLIKDWKQYFSRANVVIFPSYIFPMLYSTLDTGNFFVIPGSPAEVWEANSLSASHNEDDLRVKMSYHKDDFLVVIVGSQFSYSGMWLEHALVLQALAPLFNEFPFAATSTSLLKVVIASGNLTEAYKMSLETAAMTFGYPRGSIKCTFADGDLNSLLYIADLVIYGSFLEEQSFPPVLLQAMSLGKLVVAPDMLMIQKYVVDDTNGYLFPKENVNMLTKILLEAISNRKLSPVAQKIASVGKEHARNLMVSETIEGYAALLKNVLSLSSEVTAPKAAADIPSEFMKGWQWHLFENITYLKSHNRTISKYERLNKLVEKWNQTQMGSSANNTSKLNEAFSPIEWEEEKMIQMVMARKRLEDEELKGRTDQPHGTWEEVYRNVKRADRAKNELHERDERELERTGQPLCIYEPYFGEGAWPFLHNTSLYRGIGQTLRGRRPGADDIDGSSRLPLLSDSYYRDVLGEYGTFFALANRIDRVHRNAWIGFQSWRAVAKKASLSKKAEIALIDVIGAQRHGDTLYFWTRLDMDSRNPLRLDFWSFCDAINAGNCRFAVSEALRRMYGVQHDWNSLPPMPSDGDSWSTMHSWTLPTKSFLEFVMFSRMFVDALDAEMYEEHHRSGHCYLSLSKDRHCYSRLLELLINVWAYHSARRMVYVNPETGVMQEQHKLKGRRGQMWIKWFSPATLKSLDEDLAEEADADHPVRRWLWPLTGEIFWQGVYDRERSMRLQHKERRKQQSKEKIQRIKKRQRQKSIGKYIKPPPEADDTSNNTTTV